METIRAWLVSFGCERRILSFLIISIKIDLDSAVLPAQVFNQESCSYGFSGQR